MENLQPGDIIERINNSYVYYTFKSYGKYNTDLLIEEDPGHEYSSENFKLVKKAKGKSDYFKIF